MAGPSSMKIESTPLAGVNLVTPQYMATREGFFSRSGMRIAIPRQALRYLLSKTTTAGLRVAFSAACTSKPKTSGQTGTGTDGIGI